MVSKQLLCCFGRASCRVGKAGRSNRAAFIAALSRHLELLLLFRKDTFEIPRKFITKKRFDWDKAVSWKMVLSIEIMDVSPV